MIDGYPPFWLNKKQFPILLQQRNFGLCGWLGGSLGGEWVTIKSVLRTAMQT